MRWSTFIGWGLAALVIVSPGRAGPCEEEPDSIEIQGPAKASEDVIVALSTVPGGVDAGGTPTYQWAVVEGIGQFVGPTDGPGVEVTSSIGNTVAVELTYDDGVCTGVGPISSRWWIEFGHTDDVVKPGDMNQDGLLNLSDPIALLNHLFVGGDSPPPPCGDHTLSHAANILLLDLNVDGSVDVSDPIYALNFLFSGGPRPLNCLDDGCPCILVVDCPIRPVGDCAP